MGARRREPLTKFTAGGRADGAERGRSGGGAGSVAAAAEEEEEAEEDEAAAALVAAPAGSFSAVWAPVFARIGTAGAGDSPSLLETKRSCHVPERARHVAAQTRVAGSSSQPRVSRGASRSEGQGHRVDPRARPASDWQFPGAPPAFSRAHLGVTCYLHNAGRAGCGSHAFRDPCPVLTMCPGREVQAQPQAGSASSSARLKRLKLDPGPPIPSSSSKCSYL
jgi:hypothetical protein